MLHFNTKIQDKTAKSLYVRLRTKIHEGTAKLLCTQAFVHFQYCKATQIVYSIRQKVMLVRKFLLDRKFY